MTIDNPYGSLLGASSYGATVVALGVPIRAVAIGGIDLQDSEGEIQRSRMRSGKSGYSRQTNTTIVVIP